MSTTKPPTDKVMLSAPARRTLVTLGLALVALGVMAFLSPPKRAQFAPQCAAASCVAEIPTDSNAFSLSMIAAGAIVAVIGVNGRQIVGLKFAGAETTMAEHDKDAQAAATVKSDASAGPVADVGSEDDASSELMPAPGTARLIDVGGSEVLRVGPDQIPLRVLRDLDIAGYGVKSASDVDWGAHAVGRGNHPWYVRLVNGRVFRVSYGGQGKLEPTVVELTKR